MDDFRCRPLHKGDATHTTTLSPLCHNLVTISIVMSFQGRQAWMRACILNHVCLHECIQIHQYRPPLVGCVYGIVNA